MKILKNQNLLKRQSSNYIQGELSNIASVVQAPQLLVTWYDIDPDLSPAMTGWKNVEDYIHENSTVVYHKIEQLPMSGIDNLVTQSQFDEELGFDEDLQSSGIIFPNTVFPKPYSCFTINNSEVTALYVVTNINPVTVRSNPFIEIQFRLFSRDPEVIKQLERQVKDTYITTVSAIGLDKSLVISKESYFSIEKHIQQYLDIVDMYKTLFWDSTRSAFIFDGLYDDKLDTKISFLDLVLWRLMFDEGIIINDDIITYANNNYQKTISRVYTSCPDPYVDDHFLKISILWRLYMNDHKHNFAEFKYPQSYEPDPRIGKFTGKNIYYFERYGDTSDCNLMCRTCPTWDTEFIDRIRNNIPYETENWDDRFNNPDDIGCCQVLTSPTSNPHLRNAIINWYNGTAIDWENLILIDEKTCENYFLIPLILGAYKKYIHDLQK